MGKTNIENKIKTLLIDVSDGSRKLISYKLGEFWGPIDLGLLHSYKYNSFNIGNGILSGSIFPGSNRLVFTGISPSWHGFYISSMGGAGLPFDDLGINLVSIKGKVSSPSILYINRANDKEIEIEIRPVDIFNIWRQGRGGVYGLLDHVFDIYKDNYENSPRILAVGPASFYTDFGAIGSAPIKEDAVSHVDTWAGRGGFGTKLLQEHGIAAIIYGGKYIDKDFRDQKKADDWFLKKYQMGLIEKDTETTIKYRFDPELNTGGTLGANFTKVDDEVLAFNYKSIFWENEKRKKLHQDFIVNHYLKQFNEETIIPKNQSNCGEPCVAVCKKMRGEFKKDFEPYQAMGPLCGVFDQRAAELLNGKADSLGFDAISAGGIISWLMECVDEEILNIGDIGISKKPIFDMDGFDVVNSSMHNAKIGVEILEEIVKENSKINLASGAREYAKKLSSKYNNGKIADLFVYNSLENNGWVVPNQYWSPGVLAPMGIMGKYYNDYRRCFIPPYDLGKLSAERMIKELIVDSLGICRFHRSWAEDIMPDIVGDIFGDKEAFLSSVTSVAKIIHKKNMSVFWESERNIDYVAMFLKKKKNEGITEKELIEWIDLFDKDKKSAAFEFWKEIQKGTDDFFKKI